MKKKEQDTVRTRILYMLEMSQEMKRRSIAENVAGGCRRHIYQEIARLIDDGLIEVYRKDTYRSPQYVRLTENGQRELDRIMYKSESDMIRTRNPERKQRLLQTENLLAGCGCDVAHKNFPAGMIIDGSKDDLDEQRKNILQKMASQGVYYEIGTIRDVIDELYGHGPLDATRCMGLLIRKSNLLYVYNVGDTLIYFNQTIENRAIMLIEKAMKSSYVIDTCLDINFVEGPRCLLLIQDYDSLVNIFFQTKTGEKGINNELYKLNNRISLDSLTSVYKQVHVMTLQQKKSSARQFELKNIVDTNEIRRDGLARSWCNNHPGTMLLDCPSGSQMIYVDSGEEIFLWIDNDIVALYRLYKSKKPVHVVLGRSGPEQAIAHILGTRLLSIETYLGKALAYTPYDDDGHPLVGGCEQET